MRHCSACYGPKIYCRGCKGKHCHCLKTGIRCKTWFRKYLNIRTEYSHKNGPYQQRTRLYGDYLWHQDRDKFEVEFKEWAESL